MSINKNSGRFMEILSVICTFVKTLFVHFCECFHKKDANDANKSDDTNK